MNEADRYDEAWKTGKYKPLNGLINVQCLYRTYFFRGYKNLLDVGCGTGVAVRYHREVGGIEAFGIDFAKSAIPTWHELGAEKWCSVASAEDIPYKDNQFDMVTCTDMLEHVPEEHVPRVLREMYRVGRGDFLFMICLVPALIKMPTDGSEPHVCLKSPEWWVDRMGEIGYRFESYPTCNKMMLHCIARKPKRESILI